MATIDLKTVLEKKFLLTSKEGYSPSEVDGGYALFIRECLADTKFENLDEAEEVLNTLFTIIKSAQEDDSNIVMRSLAQAVASVAKQIGALSAKKQSA